MSFRHRAKTFTGSVKRIERRLLVKWIRFAQAHRESNILPLALFMILFLDGFVIFIPSALCLIAATMISPHRWILFGILFAVATTSNCVALYFVGRIVPIDQVIALFAHFNIEWMWDSATEALRHYGPYATFVGAIIGLPTQLIMALIGAADASALSEGQIGNQFVLATSLTFSGQIIKSMTFAGLTRFGWVRLEKRFGKDDLH